MAPPQKLTSHRIDLPDGRNVRVLSYDDGSLRFRITGGGPYALTEAYLAASEPVIVKLIQQK
jgi:hypothetical protein